MVHGRLRTVSLPLLQQACVQVQDDRPLAVPEAPVPQVPEDHHAAADVPVECDRELADLWTSAGIEAEADLPRFDPSTHQIVSLSGEVLGRAIVLHEGTSQEAQSIYCRRHQCTFLKRARDAPSMLHIRRWFHAGVAIPRGRAHKDAHRQIWAQLS